ncbi:hypothetical protein TanjilG_32251 [Lupinus angustifolius]|uniref:Uncharacterized protein n=1 Tax=Lupinus angustifolius TaxID=3871 RepID=A0A4P1RFA6_LUPAN|nr:hypothetical protein TanjilG_32251 [Lupinus angustifolius]
MPCALVEHEEECVKMKDDGFFEFLLAPWALHFQSNVMSFLSLATVMVRRMFGGVRMIEFEKARKV